MKKKNLLSGRDKELLELAERYEQAQTENRPIYMDADELADLADWYARHCKDDVAQHIVEYGLKLHPGNTELLVEQAYLYLDSSRDEEAREVVALITEQTPEVIILQARLLMTEGKLDETDLILDTLEGKYDLPNIVEIAYMYIDTGFPDIAMEWIEHGDGLYNDKESYIAVCADCCYNMGDNYEKAIEYYNKLIDRNPYSSPYWYGLARCYFELRQLDKAIEACDYALVSDDEFADAYILKGNALHELGNPGEALENYRQADKLHALPSHFIDMFIGLDNVEQKKWQEGYEYLEKAIKSNLDEKNQDALPSLFSHAAFCLYKMGDKPKAKETWDMAHGLFPQDPTPYMVEGQAYLEDDNPQESFNCWNKALALAPYADTWHDIGWICLEHAQPELAFTAFERAKEMDSDLDSINEKLALTAMLLHDKENFHKYNQLCMRPFKPEQLEILYAQFKNADKEELAQNIKQIFDSLY